MFCIFPVMKKLLNYLQISPGFIFFIFLMSYLLVVESRVRADDKLAEVFLPDAPIAQFLAALFIVFIIRISINYLERNHDAPRLNFKSYLKYFGVSFLVYLAISNFLTFIVALLFETVSRNFNNYTITVNNISRGVQFIMFGSIYLATLYSRENTEYKLKIDKYSQALDHNRIKNLKAQLNPHFLFNSLNTLDQLIEEDKEEASNFLNRFADLYRYSLETLEKDLIHLEEELNFVKDYFEILNMKYVNCYKMNIITNNNLENSLIPPFALQLLVENAIQHNLGTDTDPVKIIIRISDKISVLNTRVMKLNNKSTNGRALKNLSAQFKLLSGNDIQIKETSDSYEVILPLINLETNA